MLVKRPNAAAATAETSNNVNALPSIDTNGARSTPARPARKLESIQANMLTRSLSTPASSTIRKLSTIARIRRPNAV
jgi:hypothetical protein